MIVVFQDENFSSETLVISSAFKATNVFMRNRRYECYCIKSNKKKHISKKLKQQKIVFLF